MADLAYTDTAEPRRPSLRVALSRGGFRALAFAGIAALVAGVAAAGGGYFPTAWGWTALGLMWDAALALVLAPAIELFDEVACAPRSARRVVEDLAPSNATPANRLFAVDRDPLEGRAPVRAGE